MRKKLASLAVVAFVVALLVAPADTVASPGTITRASVASDGTQANSISGGANISADGRYVAFSSAASNLVPADTNTKDDVFVRDLHTGVTERISVSTEGAETVCPPTVQTCSGGPTISANGRFVAFDSTASNLVANDTQISDVFLRDRDVDADGTFDEPGGVATTKVSVGMNGQLANSASFSPGITPDGRYLTFVSYASNLVSTTDSGLIPDVFVVDRQTGDIERVTVDNAGAQLNCSPPAFHQCVEWVAISADGRIVAFSSWQPLVTGDSNQTADVFVHDRMTHETSRVSVDSSGLEGNSMSGIFGVSVTGNGQLVAFDSYASNLVTGDTNAQADIFIHDRQNATASRVSLNDAGAEGNGDSQWPSITPDGAS